MTLYRPRVYTASKLHYFRLWLTFREDPDWDFAHFTASWPSIAHLEQEQPSPDLFREAWLRDISEIKESDFLLVYGTEREVLKGALVEAGAAIAFGIPVLAVGLDEQTWTHHPGVRCFGSLREARQYLLRYVTMAPPTRKKSKGKSNEPDSI